MNEFKSEDEFFEYFCKVEHEMVELCTKHSYFAMPYASNWKSEGEMHKMMNELFNF